MVKLRNNNSTILYDDSLIDNHLNERKTFRQTSWHAIKSMATRVNNLSLLTLKWNRYETWFSYWFFVLFFFSFDRLIGIERNTMNGGRWEKKRSQYTFVATTYSNNEITWCDKSCWYKNSRRDTRRCCSSVDGEKQNQSEAFSKTEERKGVEDKSPEMETNEKKKNKSRHWNEI